MVGLSKQSKEERQQAMSISGMTDSIERKTGAAIVKHKSVKIVVSVLYVLNTVIIQGHLY